jgi:hypothetical protein
MRPNLPAPPTLRECPSSYCLPNSCCLITLHFMLELLFSWPCAVVLLLLPQPALCQKKTHKPQLSLPLPVAQGLLLHCPCRCCCSTGLGLWCCCSSSQNLLALDQHVAVQLGQACTAQHSMLETLQLTRAKREPTRQGQHSSSLQPLGFVHNPHRVVGARMFASTHAEPPVPLKHPCRATCASQAPMQSHLCFMPMVPQITAILLHQPCRYCLV